MEQQQQQQKNNKQTRNWFLHLIIGMLRSPLQEITQQTYKK